MRNQLLIVISLLALGGCQSIKILTTSTLEPATGDGEKTQVIPIAKVHSKELVRSGNSYLVQPIKVNGRKDAMFY